MCWGNCRIRIGKQPPLWAPDPAASMEDARLVSLPELCQPAGFRSSAVWPAELTGRPMKAPWKEEPQTFAVLGCGADVCYPRENFGIYRQIAQGGGGILSEFEPGSRPLGWHFPRRNRIISGLADLVLVVEARARSGALITADCALEQGKTVYAVPGRLEDPLSEGCNRLIFQGPERLFLPRCFWKSWMFRTGRQRKIRRKTRSSSGRVSEDFPLSGTGRKNPGDGQPGNRDNGGRNRQNSYASGTGGTGGGGQPRILQELPAVERQ